MTRRTFSLLILLLLAAPITFAAHAQEAAEPRGEAAAAKPRVTLVTSMGEIVLELEPEKAPKTVENFLAYVESGFYEDTLFHRVIAGFMIQTGGYSRDMKEKPTRPTIENESENGLSNTRGTVAMARRGDPHSASSQFYINVVDNPNLNHRGTPQGWGYTVFGRVVEGMEVADAISKVATGFRDVPVEPVVLEKATVQR